MATPCPECGSEMCIPLHEAAVALHKPDCSEVDPFRCLREILKNPRFMAAPPLRRATEHLIPLPEDESPEMVAIHEEIIGMTVTTQNQPIQIRLRPKPARKKGRK